MKPKIIGAVLLLLALSAVATADCGLRRVVQRRQAVAVNAVVATFVPIVVPAYSVTYAYPGAVNSTLYDESTGQPYNPDPQPLRRMPAAAEPSRAAVIDGLTVLQTRCASCHDKGTAEKKGAGVVLLEAGKLADLDVDTALDVCLQVIDGTMPPSRPLSDADKKAVAALFKAKK